MRHAERVHLADTMTKARMNPFEPCTSVNALEAPCEDVEQVEEEILDHGGGDEEDGVLTQERERQVRPSEVVVLEVKVALRSSSFVVVDADVALAVLPVVGDDAVVHVSWSEKSVLPVIVGNVGCTTSQRFISGNMVSNLNDATPHD